LLYFTLVLCSFFRVKHFRVIFMIFMVWWNVWMSFSLIVFNFLLCRFETMVGWIDVHAQLNGEEAQRLKVRCLGVTLRDLKDELNEFNQWVNPGDTRKVENVQYKRPALDEGRVSFSWAELKNDENVTSMFWKHRMFQWIDMQVTLLRSTEDIIKSLIPPENGH